MITTAETTPSKPLTKFAALPLAIVLAAAASGCSSSVEVPQHDEATIEQNRQTYQEMAQQERKSTKRP